MQFAVYRLSPNGTFSGGPTSSPLLRRAYVRQTYPVSISIPPSSSDGAPDKATRRKTTVRSHLDELVVSHRDNPGNVEENGFLEITPPQAVGIPMKRFQKRTQLKQFGDGGLVVRQGEAMRVEPERRIDPVQPVDPRLTGAR